MITLFYTRRYTIYNNNNYMQSYNITKIIKIGSSLGVVIPKNILNALTLERGDQVVFGAGEYDTLIIRKITDEKLLPVKIIKL